MNPFVFEFRYAVIQEARMLLSSMTLETAINCAFTRKRNYEKDSMPSNFALYSEVHQYLESLASNN